MDRRLAPIAVLTWFGVWCYLLLVLCVIGFAYMFPVLAGVMTPVMLGIFCLSLAAVFGAISDWKARRDGTDERYFTRLFLYKAMCIPFFIINYTFWLLLALGAANPFLFWSYLFVPGAILFAFVLMLSSSYQVLDGLAQAVRTGEIKKREFVLHALLQHLFMIDVADALFLMLRERKRFPKRKIALLAHIFVMPERPKPETLGVGIIFATLIIAVSAVISSGAKILLSTTNTAFFDMIAFWIFLFPFLSGVFLVIWLMSGAGIFGVIRWRRAIPAAVRENGFLRRLLFLSTVTLLFQTLLSALLFLILRILFFPGLWPFDSDDLPKAWIAIVVLFITVLLYQANVYLYTKLVTMRSLSDGVTAPSKVRMYKILSLFPALQIVALILLWRSNRGASNDSHGVNLQAL